MSPAALCVQASQVGKLSGMQPHDGVLPQAAGTVAQLIVPSDVNAQYCRPCWHRNVDEPCLGHRNVTTLPPAPPPPKPPHLEPPRAWPPAPPPPKPPPEPPRAWPPAPPPPKPPPPEPPRAWPPAPPPPKPPPPEPPRAWPPVPPTAGPPPPRLPNHYLPGRPNRRHRRFQARRSSNPASCDRQDEAATGSNPSTDSLASHHLTSAPEAGIVPSGRADWRRVASASAHARVPASATFVSGWRVRRPRNPDGVR